MLYASSFFNIILFILSGVVMDVGFIVWAIFMHSAFLRPPDPFIDYNIFFVWLKLTFINYFENANSNWVQKVQPNPRITSCIVGWKVISQDGGLNNKLGLGPILTHL